MKDNDCHFVLVFLVDLNGPTANMRGFANEMGRNLHSIANYSEPISSKMVEGNLNSSTSSLSSAQSAAAQTFESAGFMSHIRSSSNPVPLYLTTPETSSRRSRPSFLDSLIGPRVSSGKTFQGDEPEESLKSNSLMPNSTDMAGSSSFHKPQVDAQSMPKLDSSSLAHAIQPSMNSSLVNGNSMKGNREFYLPKQNEDFTALEQVLLCSDVLFSHCSAHWLS